MSNRELGSLCTTWAQAVVCSALTLCLPINGGQLNMILAPYKQCLFSLDDNCSTCLNEETQRCHTLMLV